MKKTSIQALLSKIKVDLQKELLIHFEKAIQALKENEGNIDEMKKKGIHLCIYSISYSISSNQISYLEQPNFEYEEYLIKSYILNNSMDIIGEYLMTCNMDWEVVDDSLAVY